MTPMLFTATSTLRAQSSVSHQCDFERSGAQLDLPCRRSRFKRSCESGNSAHVLGRVTERIRADHERFVGSCRHGDIERSVRTNGMIGGMLDLAEFCATVEAAATEWVAAGATWSLQRSPQDGRNKHAAWVTIEHGDLAGQLTVWDSGEAELEVGGPSELWRAEHFEDLEHAGGPLKELVSDVVHPGRPKALSTTEPLSRLALGVELTFYTTAEGGRRKLLGEDGYDAFQYRPNWRVPGVEPQGQIGAPVFCFGSTPVAPGDRTRAVIVPSAEVSLPLWHSFEPEQRLEMCEGPRVCGIASVAWSKPISLPLSEQAGGAFLLWCLGDD